MPALAPLADCCSVLVPALTSARMCRPGTTPGQDLNLSLDRVVANRNFTNKLWNAAKFILLNLETASEAEWAALQAADFSRREDVAGLPLAEAWILSALHQARPGVVRKLALETCSSSANLMPHRPWTRSATHTSAWTLAQPAAPCTPSSGTSLQTGTWRPPRPGCTGGTRLLQLSPERCRPGGLPDTLAQQGCIQGDSLQVLVYGMRQILSAAHPLMPFVTEELWSALPTREPLLIAAPWPSHQGAVDVVSLSHFSVRG